jgi:hypothetical protein
MLSKEFEEFKGSGVQKCRRAEVQKGRSVVVRSAGVQE